MNFQPIYRLILRQPPSADPTEAAVLTPPAGAAHADPFQVATHRGVAGFLPYLEPPNGRRARVDPKTKKVDVGPMTLEVADPMLVAPDPSSRWASQFLGDAEGVDALLKTRAEVSESLDGGETFAPYWTGRLQSARGSQSVAYVLTLRDLVDDLSAALFPSFPAPAVAYAFRQPVVPLALRQDWGPFRGGAPAYGSSVTGIVNGWSFTTRDPYWNNVLLTQALVDAAETSTKTTFGSWYGGWELGYPAGRVRVWIEQVGTANAGWAYLRSVSARRVDVDGVWKWVIQSGKYDLAPVGEGQRLGAVPPANWPLFVALYPDPAPSEASPLFIRDVHAAELARDVCLGRFGAMDTDGVTPLSALPIDEASFDALIADPTVVRLRFVITAQTNRKKWLEEAVCRPAGLGLYPGPDGRFRLIDLRTDRPLGELSTIGPPDLIADADGQAFRTTADDAVGLVNATFYADEQIPLRTIALESSETPAPPGGAIRGVSVPLEYLDVAPRALDFGTETMDLDLAGVRALLGKIDPVPGERLRVGQASALSAKARAVAIVDAAVRPFRFGARYLTVRCRRTAVVEATTTGVRVYLDLPRAPDPLTKVHGGARVGLCVERQEDGPTCTLVFLDLGDVAESEAPVLGALTLDAANPHHGVTQQVTRNAAGDAVELQVARTDDGETEAPPDASGEWGPLGTARADGGATFGAQPSRTRIWVRGRSVPAATGRVAVPSAWAYPDAPGYVDTAAYAPPIAVAVANVTAGTADASFTPGEPTLPTQRFLHPAAAWAAWSDADTLGAMLPPGTTAFALLGLESSADWTLGLRHVDPYGGTTEVAALTFAAAGALLVAPRPAGLAPIVPSSVELRLFAADPRFALVVERAPDVAGAPDAGAVVELQTVPGTTRSYADPRDADGSRWHYRLRHRLAGYQDSAPTGWVAATASAAGVDSGNDGSAGSGSEGGGGVVVPEWQAPTIVPVPSQTADTATLRLVIDDPQGRLVDVAFKSREGAAGAETAYAVDPDVPYEASAAIPANDSSVVTGRVRYVGATGNVVTVELPSTFTRGVEGGGAGGGYARPLAGYNLDGAPTVVFGAGLGVVMLPPGV